MVNFKKKDLINKKKTIFISFLFLSIILIIVSCTENAHHSLPEIVDSLPKGHIIIENGSSTTKSCTPLLEVFIENAVYMAFSGNGISWSSWIPYSLFYNDFNIADGTCGTTMGSGIKTIYVRFMDIFGGIYPDYAADEVIFSIIKYEMQELFSIKIEPVEATVKTGERISFKVRGFDLYLNEVPLSENKIIWSKTCLVGSLNPVMGLETTYIAPDIPGLRNISANYGKLSTGAKVYVIR